MVTAKKTGRRTPKQAAPKRAAKAKPRVNAKPRASAKPRAATQRKKPQAQSKTKAAPKAQGRARAAGATRAGAGAKGKTAATRASAGAKGKSRPKSSTKVKAKAQPGVTAAKSRPARRDAVGRLDPQYARDLRAMSRENRPTDGDRAFFSKPRTGDDLAEELGEEAVGSMTSGEDQSDRLLGEVVEEERGGPFIKTRGGDEFARGTDRSNPRGSTREPFPRT